MYHGKECWCDKCVWARMSERKEEKEREQKATAYLKRRGGEIGQISLEEANRRGGKR